MSIKARLRALTRQAQRRKPVVVIETPEEREERLAAEEAMITYILQDCERLEAEGRPLTECVYFAGLDEDVAAAARNGYRYLRDFRDSGDVAFRKY